MVKADEDERDEETRYHTSSLDSGVDSGYLQMGGLIFSPFSTLKYSESCYHKSDRTSTSELHHSVKIPYHSQLGDSSTI
jgi:hypothetical protein